MQKFLGYFAAGVIGALAVLGAERIAAPQQASAAPQAQMSSMKGDIRLIKSDVDDIRYAIGRRYESEFSGTVIGYMRGAQQSAHGTCMALTSPLNC